jgi:hypothetical protein
MSTAATTQQSTILTSDYQRLPTADSQLPAEPEVPMGHDMKLEHRRGDPTAKVSALVSSLALCDVMGAHCSNQAFAAVRRANVFRH